jgi:hypothetical protein
MDWLLRQISQSLTRLVLSGNVCNCIIVLCAKMLWENGGFEIFNNTTTEKGKSGDFFTSYRGAVVVLYRRTDALNQ